MSIRDDLKKEIALAVCERVDLKCLNLAYIDLDRFVYHNDAFGHASGDEALNKIFTALTAFAAAHSAKVKRVGGDEFLVYSLSDSTGLHIELGKKAQSCVHEQEIPLVSDGYRDGNVDLPKHITCSVAATSFPTQSIGKAPHPESDLMIKESIVDGLLQLLDTMLWLSKCAQRGKFAEVNLCV